MAAVHYSCLSKWAAEKRSVVCELCKQEYKEPYLTQIKEVVEGRPPP
jgi:E3 ubiquitin-protein ligase DOA10